MSNDLPLQRNVPIRGLVLSLGALLVPVAGALVFPARLGEAGALLWLVALVPAFLLAYYRGWRGVATALASGMAVLALTQVVALLTAREVPDLLFWIVIAYVALAFAIGWVTELLHRERAAVESLALTDLLTRLPNRRHARAFLQNEFGAAQRGRPLCVVLFDLDDFKTYNDRWGHQAGDEALREFAEILLSTTRKMNLSSRFGGEEFLSILAGSEVEGALVFTDRVQEQLEAMRLPSGPLTVSAGIAAYHPSMKGFDELVAAADLALYRAKGDGKNQVRVFGRPADTAPGSGRILEPEHAGGERAGGGNGGRAGGGHGGDQHAGIGHPGGEDTGRGYAGARQAGAGGSDGNEWVQPSRPHASLLPERPSGFGKGRRVLLVEDDSGIRALVGRYLMDEGFTVHEAQDTLEGRAALSREFDVVLTDIRFQGPPGTELIAVVKARWPATQVVALSGLRDAHVAAQALRSGADSYIFKPFGMPELQARLVDCLARRDREVERSSRLGEASPDAAGRSATARASAVAGVRALVRAMEARDPYVRGHSQRVGEYAAMLADVLGLNPSEMDRDELKLACEFHDVGKLQIPDSILNKQAPLSTDELREVRKHPGAGRQILEPLFSSPLILSVTSWHHERWDGSGYPDRLAGEVIPLAARIVSIADALEAMTNERAYRQALPWDEAVEQIREGTGLRFDPNLMDGFEEALPALRRLHDVASVSDAVSSRSHGRPVAG